MLEKDYPDISKPTQHIKLLKDLATDTASSILQKETYIYIPPSLVSVCCWGYESQDPELSEKVV